MFEFGEADQAAQKYQQAIENYKKAKQLAPTLSEPCVGWSNVLNKLKNPNTDSEYEKACKASH